MLISTGGYVVQQMIQGKDITPYGLGMAALGGFVSGLTFGVGNLSSLFISFGTEIASGFEDIIEWLKKLKGQRQTTGALRYY